MSTLLQRKYPKSYEQLRFCSALQLDLYFYLDEEEEIIGCNEAVLQVTGFRSFEALQARMATLPQIFVSDPESPLPEVGDWLERIADGPPLQVELRDRNDKSRVYAVYARTVRNDDVPLHLLILHEITVVEKAREAKRYYDGLTRELIVNISRQFRSPLNGIVGFTGLLDQTALDDTQQEYAMHIRDAAESITTTVDNLLALSQADRGEISAQESAFEPLELYERIGARYGALARAKGITLMFMFDPALPKSLFGDADKVIRVLRNLIDNAIRYTQRGGQVLVEVLCKECDDTYARVEYAVSDTGAGIDADSLKTILRPFTPSHRATEPAGLGIGLNLSHKLLGVMRSQLRVASKVGKGSRFSFLIEHRTGEAPPFGSYAGCRAVVIAKQPEMALQGKLLLNYLKRFGVFAEEAEEIDKPLLARAELLFLLDDAIGREKAELLKNNYPNLKIAAVVTPEREQELGGELPGTDALLSLPLLPDRLDALLARQPALPETAIEEPAAPARRFSLLIAEDNPINQKLLMTLLTKHDYELVVANNGKEAVDAYMSTPYDLVLMDIDMPVMDGITATRLIHEIDASAHRGRVPVIALTAHALPGDKERLLEAGMTAHIAKPVDTAILLKTIRRYLVELPSEAPPEEES